MVDLINGIFIEATIILAVNKAWNYESFHPFQSAQDIDYIKCGYYLIVCFSTIGYGDIYPIHWFSRMVMVMLLLINITVMSNFLGKCVRKELKKKSKRISYCDLLLIMYVLMFLFVYLKLTFYF